ncbi:MAG: hypothetical protein L3J87_00970 [Thermoplasmata archaeon]|nr:hypothetical protein [Thermoplasmata archaeon]MCI4344186.1 hypothetical protein [Thermoplasmata archaeon]
MTVNLRLSLTIFSVGFAIEGVGSLYSFLTHTSELPGQGFLLYLSPVFTVVGLLFLFLGRREWGELHQRRVRHAHLTFLLVAAFFVLAVIPIGVYTYLVTGATPPYWVTIEFGAAVGAMFLFAYVTYFLIVVHLLGAAGKAAVMLALAWSMVVSIRVGLGVAGTFPTYLLAARTRVLSTSGLAGPIITELSLLFVAYFLYLFAFVDAHRRILRQGTPPGSAPPSPIPS